MAYEIKRVDVTTLDRAIILHGVNCQSAMGSGIAGALARKWPKVRSSYIRYIDVTLEYFAARQSVWPTAWGDQTWRRQLLGSVQYVDVSDKLDRSIIVANCFTQFNFGGDGQRYACTESILEALFSAFNTFADARGEFGELPPIYLPQIGCGLGGLIWESEVKPIYDMIATQYPDIPFTVCTL